ncbi:MAG TPA: hypothetical protein VGO85_21945 [Caldimonas sp.]|jgi:hypothetical protein|nr:hypothetical protein [Caldimonas sp.]
MASTVITPLALQPPEAVQAYIRAGIVAIDAELGLGYAKANPQLLGAFLQACTTFYEAEVLKQAGDEV